MEKSSRNSLEILLITFIIFTPKWICSYFFFPDESLLVKTLLDVDDVHYFLNVISFSNFDLNPSFNEFVKSEKIITFPFFSIIYHSFFYKLLGYTSFVLLEVFFTFLSILIFYKIFEKFDLNKNYCFLIVVTYFSLPVLMNLLNYIDLSQISHLQALVTKFIDPRFPRPLITNVYFLLGIYFLLSLQKELLANKDPTNIINISVLMALQINSFFYFFFIQFFATLFLLLAYKKNFFFNYIFSHYKTIIKSILITSIGLAIFLIQSLLGESDYSGRIGVNSIDFDSKVFLVKYFILNLARVEVLTFIGVSLILFFYIKRFVNNFSNQINIFSIIIISSLFSTIFFIIISNKIISLYHFANIFLFSFILFIFISIVFIINNFTYLKIFLIKVRYYIYILLFFLTLIFNSVNLLNKDLRHEYVKVNDVLKEIKLKNSDAYLFTNNLQVQVGWLFNGFKNIVLTNGFNNSLNDKQIEDTFSKTLKTIFNEKSQFNKILEYKNKKDNHRNTIMSYFFNYKYQANSFYMFSNENDYSSEELRVIKQSSPLRSQIHILPNSEKKRINSLIQNQKDRIDVKMLLVVIDKKTWPKDFNLKKSINKDFQIILENDHYFIAQTKF